WSWILEVDIAVRTGVLVRDREGLVALKDLKGKRHVGRARNAGQIALDLGVARQPVLLVLSPLREPLGRVRDAAADHDAYTRGDRSDGAERDDFLRGHWNNRARPHHQRGTRDVGLEIVVPGVERRPDAGE